MHNNIYEITVDAIDRDDWATESNFYDDDHVDYVTEMEGEERDEAIDDFCKHPDFTKLFTRGEEPDTIVYNGKIDEVTNEWYDNIQKELDEMRKSGKVDSYRLRKAIDRTFFGDELFCLPGHSGTESSFPRELLEMLRYHKAGTVLHINAVFDYHW